MRPLTSPRSLSFLFHLLVVVGFGFTAVRHRRQR